MRQNRDNRLLSKVETNLETQAQRENWISEAKSFREPQETEKEMAIRMLQELKNIWKMKFDAESEAHISNHITPATKERFLARALAGTAS